METYSQNEDDNEWPDDNAEEWPDVIEDPMQIDSMGDKLDSNMSDNVEMSKNVSYNETQIKSYAMDEMLKK